MIRVLLGKAILVSLVFGVLILNAIPVIAALSPDDLCEKAVAKQALRVVREITEKEYYRKPAPNPRYGRFFEARDNDGMRATVWTMPFAQGKACVVREVL